MKEYDLIAIGSGSAANVIGSAINENPKIRIALIEKDEPGGICLTRGCIPSKMLVHPADLIRDLEMYGEAGISVEVKGIHFEKIMARMRVSVSEEMERIRRDLSRHPHIDFYPAAAEFVAPYTLKVGREEIKAPMIFLCTGSKPRIPNVKGLGETGYLTSDSVLKLTSLPKSIMIFGGGYIAAEYGHFFSSMGSEVAIFGRNPRFLPEEEPEVSTLAKRVAARYMTVVTNCEALEVEKTAKKGKRVVLMDRDKEKQVDFFAEEILVAAGRAPNTDILHPERSGVKTDAEGWIAVDEYLETSQPNIWAFGDADGKYLFKHKANYESVIVYYNAFLKHRVKADYHAVPHAVFSRPEIASVGLREREAAARFGEDRLLIGWHRFQDTARGEVLGVKDCFVKVILERDSLRLLGAHIIGPQASILIQEIINLMYTPDQSARPILRGMHIHPALSEVVERAFYSLRSPHQYQHLLDEYLRPERRPPRRPK